MTTKLQEAQEALQQAQDYVDSLRVELDPHRDLKKTYSEGAIIEAKQSYNEWHEDDIPRWYFDSKYRIKDDISIDSWTEKYNKLSKYNLSKTEIGDLICNLKL